MRNKWNSVLPNMPATFSRRHTTPRPTRNPNHSPQHETWQHHHSKTHAQRTQQSMIIASRRANKKHGLGIVGFVFGDVICVLARCDVFFRAPLIFGANIETTHCSILSSQCRWSCQYSDGKYGRKEWARCKSHGCKLRLQASGFETSMRNMVTT